jgi:hypothetical protein
MVAGGDAGDARANLADDPRPFMAENARPSRFAIEPVERVGVGVADAGGLISTSTSPAFGPSRSSSTISSGFLASNATAAWVFMHASVAGVYNA